MATLTPLSPQANVVPKKSIAIPHYKRHRTKTPTKFHSPSPTMHKTLQSKMSFSKASTFSAMIPKLNIYFLYHHLFHSNTTKNIGNFLVRSAFKSENQQGTFKCTGTPCKTCPSISNMVKISGPNLCIKITDYFTCISANVIYCINSTLYKKIYIGETGRRLADCFRKHLRDVGKNDTDASKPFAHHSYLPNHSHHNMTICGLSLHHRNTERRKKSPKKVIFQLGTLYPQGINERLSFH